MVNRPWQDKERLQELFLEKGMTTYEIGEKLGCAQVTVSKWLKKHDIETDFETHDTLRDEQWLRTEYIEKGKSQHEIADDLGCCQMTVSRWCRKHGIETRKANYEKHGCHGWDNNGYEFFSHTPKDGGGGRVKVHRLMMVVEEGVEAVKDKHVHHKNEVRWDNREENLELLMPSDHLSHHRNKGEGSHW
jgi:transcriptional regulator with XRE-family HTH domain